MMTIHLVINGIIVSIDSELPYQSLLLEHALHHSWANPRFHHDCVRILALGL